MSVTIEHADFVDSIAGALQFISYYHPPEFIAHLAAAYRLEQSGPAKQAIAQILVNSRMCAEGHRPICQDTGVFNVFLKVGMEVRFRGFTGSLADAVNEAVRLATLNPDNRLRASMVAEPLFARRNTGDNTPAVVHTQIVAGATVEIAVMAKGGGGDNQARFTVLLPSDSLVDWVVRTVPGMGAGWCPPGVLGIGAGGAPEKAMVMAKESLLAPIDMMELKVRGPSSKLEELRIEICDKVNALGIGAQGLGGLTTVMDVKIDTFPAHASSIPVALIPNCAATRCARVLLVGGGATYLDPPTQDLWPIIPTSSGGGVSSRVDLNALTRSQVQQWKVGETLLLSGKLLTGRDAAHKRIQEAIANEVALPVDFTNRLIYFVGPIDPVGDEAVGPAGPTTATRMDKFTEMMLSQTGLIGMVGKAERGPAAVDSIRSHGAAYLMATGGAAYLLSKSIRAARVIAFADLGMEAIYEFDVVNMPVLVAVDSSGANIHEMGPARWRTLLRAVPAVR